ncbi:unnamed protein product [Mytilus coruscus]|uniref:Uncharacterized protein n=1 Tax=Mytilus coruscus TaxID=42192 RepID=A0A6J8EL72_MYTCO|nr:unnamed protein product [Mytilus coruscus]
MNLKILANNHDITSLEEIIKMLKTDMEQKYDEILSLKMHASSQSENNSFIQGPPTHKPKKPHVRLIGTQIQKNIECKYHETIEVIERSTEETDLVLLHSLTNELKENTPEYCLEQMHSIINTCSEKWPRAKKVISLVTPRPDGYNTKVDLLNTMIKFTFADSLVFICDNSNLSRRGVPQSKFQNMTDKYHLSQAGTSQLAANFKESICTCIGIKYFNLLQKNIEFVKTDIVNSQESIDAASDKLESIILDAAKLCLRLPKQSKKKVKHKNWYDSDLRFMRNHLFRKGRQLSNDPFNTTLRNSFFRQYRHYNKSNKYKIESYKNDIIKKLESLHNNNPKQYWDLVNSLKENEKSTPSVEPDKFYEHFKNLNSLNPKYECIYSFILYLLISIKTLQTVLTKLVNECMPFNEMDFKISEKEITSTIKKNEKQ